MIFFDVAHASSPELTPAAEAAETDAAPGVLASLGINGSLFFSQLINFAIVAAVIWFLILKPLTKKMAERQKMIDESLDNAKKVEENLRRSEHKYQERIDQAKVEANKIIEKSTTEAEGVGVQMKEKAKKEIETLIDQAKRNIRIEKDEMVSALKKENADIIIMALEKILEEKITSDKDKRLIEKMVKKLE